MNRFTSTILAGAMALSAGPVFAQAAAPAAPVVHPVAGNIYCGGPPANNTVVAANDVSTCELNPVLARAGEAMQLVRGRTLIYGQVGRAAMVGFGSFVDWEKDPNGPTIANVRFEYDPNFRLKAARLTVEPKGGGTLIASRVVKVDRAWNETPIPGANPVDVTDAKIIAMRKAMVWMSPHGAVMAAAFTSKGLCPDARTSPAAMPLKCPTHKVSVTGDKTVNFTLYGFDYVMTLDADDRPARISTTVMGTPMVAIYSGYKDGLGMGGSPSDVEIAKALDLNSFVITNADLDRIAQLNGPLDKFRVGVFYPEKVTLQIATRTVLDITVIEGWTGGYQIFPDPEVVRAATK